MAKKAKRSGVQVTLYNLDIEAGAREFLNDALDKDVFSANQAKAITTLLLAFESLEHSHDSLMDQRDDAQDMADKLAEGIGLLLDVDVGEHSNVNNPWTEALEAAQAELDRRAKAGSQ